MNSLAKSETPDFSIIVPAYNQAKFLGTAIESVLMQGYRSFELLIIDDGSTDKTMRIAQSYVDRRIRCFHQQNSGLSVARNTGIAHSTGHYLIFLDSDDFLEPHALLRHWESFARQPGLDVSIGGWRFVNQNGRPIGQPKSVAEEITLSTLLMGNPFPVNAAAVNRECLNLVHHFDPELRACEDWDMWLRLLLAGCTMAAFKEPVCAYRMHMGQMTREHQRMHMARLTVLDNALQSEQAQAMDPAFHSRCVAAIYIKSAARAYSVGDWATGKRDLSHAIELDAALMENNGQMFMQLVAGWADAPYIENSLTYVVNIYHNLPATALRWVHPKRDISHIAIQMAFEAYQQCNWPKVRSAVLQAIFYHPPWLLNRGVLSIFVRSFWKRFWVAKPIQGARAIVRSLL